LISNACFGIFNPVMPYFNPKNRVALAVCVLGFAALASQMLFIREFAVAFYGNELSLGVLFAVWMFWTAIGSGALPRLFPIRRGDVRRLRLVCFLLSLALPLTDMEIRFSRTVLRSTSGEIIGFGPMLVACLIVFAPFCLLSGYAYASACRTAPDLNPDESRFAPRVYAIEAFGSAIGGLVASVLLFPLASPVQIIAALSGLIVFAGWNVPPRNVRSKRRPALILLLLAAVAVPILTPGIQPRLDKAFWKNGELLVSRNTPYGNAVVARTGSQISFYENGMHLFTVPDELSSEEAVHYALLEHPAPEKVLLIGGSLGGALEQAFRHPSVKAVDAVELDPEIIRLAKRFLPSENRSFLDDPRVTFYLTDARRFIGRTKEKYDAVLLNLPNPYTAQLNRFYTVEFFTEVRRRLNTKGVLSFALPSSENAVGRELSDFLGTVSATLSAAFPNVLILPGVDCRFIASADGSYLTSDPAELAKRIQERNLKTAYVRDYYLNYQFSKERLDYIRTRLHSVRGERINRDFKPLAFWYDLILWSKHFIPGSWTAFERLHAARTLLGILLLSLLGALILFGKRKNGSAAPAIRLSIWSIGFGNIALELVLLLAYQTSFGVLYRDMAVIVAGCMAGLGIGSLTAAVRKSLPPSMAFKRLSAVQLMLGLFPAVSGGFIILIHQTPMPKGIAELGTVLFVFLNALNGFFCGTAFGLANRLFSSFKTVGHNPAGKLYALDLLGSLAGSLLATALAVPLLGITNTLWGISAINLIAFVILWLSSRRLHDAGESVS
jgi:spermidine synthase